MFGDFKNLSYLVTKNKFRKLKDIFDRLGLSSLEERINRLSSIINSLDTQVQAFEDRIITQGHGPLTPPPPPGPPPVVPTNIPDLAIISLTPSVYTNYVNFKIVIQNIGLVNSSSTTLSELIPGLFNNSDSIPSLIPNETIERNIQIPFDPSGTLKNITFLSEVLPVLNETNTSNNSASTTTTIKTDYLPDGNTYVIVHLHNPEGKEIGSLTGTTLLIGYESGSLNPAVSIGTHNIRQLIPSGTHLFTAYFNGINLSQSVNCPANQTTIITFIFPRTIADINFSIDDTITYPNTSSSFLGEVNYSTGGQINTYNISWVAHLSANLLSYTSNLISTIIPTINSIPPVSLSVNARWGHTYNQFLPNAPIDIDVPIYTQFNRWWVQSKSLGNNFQIFLLDTAPYPYTVTAMIADFMNINDTYLSLPLSSINYKKMLVLSPNFLQTNSYIPGLPSNTDTLSGGFSYLFMSSVPYDFEGIGF
jgi:hypothetical protein